MTDKLPRAYQRLYRKLTIENLWLYIMKILIEESQPLRAYDIKLKLKEKFGIDPPAVTVYTVIYRMSIDGLISRVKSGEEVKYQVTERGREAFQRGILLLEEVLSKLKL